MNRGGFEGLPDVDRRLFVPETVYVREDNGGDGWNWLVPLRRGDDPEGWERVVASPDAVITQTDENNPRLPGVGYPPGKGFFATSSSSAIPAMVHLLGRLRVEPGMRVLEVGTGTGYNAACLAALGCEVVSVEIDADLAEQARGNLREAGYGGVVVVTGDGEYGASAWAPYDRVIATAACHTVPYPWVEQVRDGGLIVTPYTGEGCRYGTLVLRVTGGTAVGGIEGDAAYMPLRGQTLTPADQNRIETWPGGLRIVVRRDGQLVEPLSRRVRKSPGPV